MTCIAHKDFSRKEMIFGEEKITKRSYKPVNTKCHSFRHFMKMHAWLSSYRQEAEK